MITGVLLVRAISRRSLFILPLIAINGRFKYDFFLIWAGDLMKRYVALVGALFFLAALGYAASVVIDYGSTAYKTYELNDNMFLNIVVSGVPREVGALYVVPDPSLSGEVFCAPGQVSRDRNSEWDAQFSCILLKGSYEGDLVFKPSNVSDLNKARTTRLSLSVSEKQVWYTNYAYAPIGGRIIVGQYAVRINDSDVVTADIEVDRGSIPVFAGVVFIGQEIKVSNDFHLIFNGFSKKRGMAFFTIKTRFPTYVSSSAAERYLAVAPTYFALEKNRARVEIYTNCSKVTVCDGNDRCHDFDVPDTHRVIATFSEGNYTVSCYGTDKKAEFSVVKPPVVVKTVTKTVEKHEDPNDVCPSWFFNLPDYRKASLCGSVPKSKPNSGGGVAFDWRWIVLLLLIGAGAWWYFKRRGGSSGEEEEREVEAVPDVEG